MHVLGGFGNNMVGNENDEIPGEDGEEKPAGAAEDALNQQQLDLQRKGQESAALRKKLMVRNSIYRLSLWLCNLY